MSWNAENLSRELRWLPTLLERYGSPEVACFQEARIRATDDAGIDELQDALPGYACHYSLNRDPQNVSFRGGRASGVVTYVREAVAQGEAHVPAWDLEGRVVVTRLSELTVVNVYAVNGTDRPYFDHDLGRLEGDRHGFKRRLQGQIFDLAAELSASGPVLCTGDWNVSRTPLDTYPRLRTEGPHVRARAELEEHVARTGLVDIFRHLHPTARQYTWYNRRVRRGLDAARVDYMLLSPELVPRVTACRILTEADDRGGSDHSPLLLSLSAA